MAPGLKNRGQETWGTRPRFYNHEAQRMGGMCKAVTRVRHVPAIC